MPHWMMTGRFSKDNVTSIENTKARGKEWPRLPVLSFPLCHWSIQFWDLRAPSLLSSRSLSLLNELKKEISLRLLLYLISWVKLHYGRFFRDPMPRGGGGGGTLDFKWRQEIIMISLWQGWSNGDKNQNPKKSIGLPTKTPKIQCRKKKPGDKCDRWDTIFKMNWSVVTLRHTAHYCLIVY